MHDELEALSALGITLPSPAYLVGAVVFGLAGLLAYYDGKRERRPRERWLGVALMLYPYVIGETWLLYCVGVALCIGAWSARRIA
jgi:apolipoprotein N-acyltransferase